MTKHRRVPSHHKIKNKTELPCFQLKKNKKQKLLDDYTTLSFAIYEYLPVEAENKNAAMFVIDQLMEYILDDEELITENIIDLVKDIDNNAITSVN
jgi:hypothetical protein